MNKELKQLGKDITTMKGHIHLIKDCNGAYKSILMIQGYERDYNARREQCVNVTLRKGDRK